MVEVEFFFRVKNDDAPQQLSLSPLFPRPHFFLPSRLLLLTASASDSGTRRISRPRAMSCWERGVFRVEEGEKGRVRHGFSAQSANVARDPRSPFARVRASLAQARAALQQMHTYLVRHAGKKERRSDSDEAGGAPLLSFFSGQQCFFSSFLFDLRRLRLCSYFCLLPSTLSSERERKRVGRATASSRALLSPRGTQQRLRLARPTRSLNREETSRTNPLCREA